MNEPCDERPLAEFQAVCADAAQRLRQRGYPEVTAEVEPAQVIARLRLAKRTREFERAGSVRHALFLAAGLPVVLLRRADYLPIWRETYPTVHVERRGEVWVSGVPRDSHLQAVAECVEAALRAAGPFPAEPPAPWTAYLPQLSR